jgi:hypothetical protein
MYFDGDSIAYFLVSCPNLRHLQGNYISFFSLSFSFLFLEISRDVAIRRFVLLEEPLRDRMHRAASAVIDLDCVIGTLRGIVPGCTDQRIDYEIDGDDVHH